MDEEKVPAVDIRDVYKSYNKKTPVLQGTDLLVKRGNIYGLLGPSGCGKTTLLKLVVGRLSPQSGTVRVLGHKPGTKASGVPGTKIGYMPQELALYMEFTVSETMHFFGRIHKMTGVEIKSRIDFLVSFLDLPPASRKVSQLSGGQQRRVSLAVALLHSPEILILDEPTVGVDPLLRQRIWDHLVGIASTNGTSIIITTHYIEEARSANAVGLMRNGRILAEDAPDNLMEKYKQDSLEDVFLHLCLRDDNLAGGSMKRGRSTREETAAISNLVGKSTADAMVVDPSLDDEDDVRLLGNGPSTVPQAVVYDEMKGQGCAAKLAENVPAIPKARNIAALVIKNVNQLRRKLGFMLFQFLLPAIQITLFSFCIGGTPENLPIHIVNEDIGLGRVLPLNLSISDAFISGLDQKVMNIHHSDSVADAKQAVRNGTSWAALYFDEDYSVDSFYRMNNSIHNKTISAGANISIWMDETNQQIVLTLKSKFIEAFQSLETELVKQVKDRFHIPNIPTDFLPSMVIPLDYKTPIFGTDKETFLDFVAPGIMCSIIYFLAVGLTTLSLVMERKEGLFERSLVSGVTVAEIMLGHIGTEFLVMAIQTAVLLVFAFPVFNVYNVGPIIIIIMFELLIGFTGMCLGFVISTGANDEQSATQLSLAVVFPFLLVSGILWPVQAMPQWLQYIAVCLPLTLPVEGLRSVLGRGWGLDHYIVWRGYCVGAGWAVGFLLLSLLLSKVKGLN